MQQGTRGPFAERSVLSADLEDRARAVPGVLSARSFTTATIQREHQGKPLRLAVVGLSWPQDKGAGLPLVAGRALAAAHRELLADRSLGLPLGAEVLLGDERYTVVGLTKGLISASGDGVAALTERDALEVLDYQPPESRRLEREARVARLGQSDLSGVALSERLRDDRAGLPALPLPTRSAVMIKLAPGASLEAVRARLAAWPDVSVFTAQGQRDLLLGGVVEKSRQQLKLFRALLSVVSTIVVALVLFNMTVAKTREIALLKLIGARDRLIAGLILQQALMLGALGYGVAVLVGSVAFDRFPRRVLVTREDLLVMAALVVFISVAASLAGIRRALSVRPNAVLAG
jgi:putative ABC transport system permease protein